MRSGDWKIGRKIYRLYKGEENEHLSYIFFERRKYMSKIVFGFLGGILATVNNLIWMFLGLLLGCLMLDRKPAKKTSSGGNTYSVKYNEKGDVDWKL